MLSVEPREVDGTVSISMGSILAFVGFLFQVGLTVGAIAFSHGGLNQRVRAVEDKLKDHGALEKSVTRLETEMESVGREIRGLREDLKLARNELRAEVRQRPAGHQRPVQPYSFTGAREWIEDDQ